MQYWQHAVHWELELKLVHSVADLYLSAPSSSTKSSNSSKGSIITCSNSKINTSSTGNAINSWCSSGGCSSASSDSSSRSSSVGNVNR